MYQAALGHSLVILISNANNITHYLLSLSLVSLATGVTATLFPDIVKYLLGDKIALDFKPLNCLYVDNKEV